MDKRDQVVPDVGARSLNREIKVCIEEKNVQKTRTGTDMKHPLTLPSPAQTARGWAETGPRAGEGQHRAAAENNELSDLGPSYTDWYNLFI